MRKGGKTSKKYFKTLKKLLKSILKFTKLYGVIISPLSIW